MTAWTRTRNIHFLKRPPLCMSRTYPTSLRFPLYSQGRCQKNCYRKIVKYVNLGLFYVIVQSGSFYAYRKRIKNTYYFQKCAVRGGGSEFYGLVRNFFYLFINAFPQYPANPPPAQWSGHEKTFFLDFPNIGEY